MSARTLRAEAHEACRNRGHNMTRFTRIGKSYRTGKWNWWRSRCKDCGAEVDVKMNPQPNEIDIGGNAVALNCPIDPKEGW